MNEPATEAGRRLLAYRNGAYVNAEDILAIEQEARADLAARIEEYREALIWCSGSPSFGPDGEAREGWLRVCQPLLDREASDDRA